MSADAGGAGEMSDFDDGRQLADDANFSWDGLEDPDESLPPDPIDVDDQEWLTAQFARDAERTRHEPFDVPDDGPADLTEEQFAREFLDGGANATAGLLGSLEPGPRTAALLAMLQPASLSPASMVSVIAATEKLASWVQARQHRWLATFACPGVAAPVDELLAYASQPGQPLNPRSRSKARPSEDDGLVSSGSAVHGDPDVDTALDESAIKVAAAEIGAALHFSPMAAHRRVCSAVEFAVDLPGTLRALDVGSIDRGRALTIADRTQNLPVELRRRVEQAVLPKATTRTPGQLRGIVDRAVISVDPAAAKKRQEKAVAQRNVTHHAAEDGMGVFRAELSADKAQLAYSVIDQLAHQLKRTNLSACDPRGVGALRADVFSDLIDQLASTGTVTIRSTLRRRAAENRAAPDQATQTNSPGPAEESGRSDDVGQSGVEGEGRHGRSADGNSGGTPTGGRSSSGAEYSDGTRGAFHSGTGFGTHQGRVTHLNVTIAASTLAGLDERPGDLDGHGPIPADLARAIAASASTISVIAIQPGCGTGLDLGRTVYRPRLAQLDHVTTRDQTCRFPGCRRAAKRCQIDHSDEFCPGESDGGVTCLCNLQCLCVFHHGLKTAGLWDSVRHSDASVTWISPTGRSYFSQPRQWPTDSDDAPIDGAPDIRREPRNAATDDSASDSSQEPIADPPPF